jgi:adenylate kinase
MRIVVIGRPASGKSTLTDRLVRAEPDVATFGVRRHFAREIAARTALGRAAEDVVKANGWIPDELVARAVRQELDRGVLGSRFILEGMPGNRRQAELLDALLDEIGLPLHAAVHVDTPQAQCRARAAVRLVCQQCDGGSHQVVTWSDGRCRVCGAAPVRRATDAPEQFARRLAQHAELAPALLAYYRGERLIELSGLGTPAELAMACRQQLAPRLGARV